MDRKGLFTVFFSVIALLCIVCFIIGDGKKISSMISQSSTFEKVSQSPSSTDSQSINTDKSMQVDQNQLCEAGEPVIIQHRTLKDVYKLQFTITNTHISRQLEDKFKSRILNRSEMKFSDLVVSEDYTFLKDFYYLYVTVNVKNVSKRTFYVVNELKYVTNENGRMSYVGIDSLNNVYNGTKYDSYECAYLETDNKHLLSRGYIKDFFEGDDLTYDVCYMITDDAVKKNNVYFADPFGMRLEVALADKEQKYIKVDIEENNEKDNEN